jgi:hypothetical protein
MGRWAIEAALERGETARYIFEEREEGKKGKNGEQVKARLQELGPRFERRLQAAGRVLNCVFPSAARSPGHSLLCHSVSLNELWPTRPHAVDAQAEEPPRWAV